MEKIIHGVFHDFKHGLSTANLVKELKPDKVLVERSNLRRPSCGGEIMPINEMCQRLGIPIIPIDKSFTSMEFCKCIIFYLFDIFLNIAFGTLCHIYYICGRGSVLSGFSLYLSASKHLPFANFIDNVREQHFIKVIEREDIREGLMLIVVGLAHVKSLRDYFER